MSLRKTANLVIYRFRERGLEVFMLNSSEDKAVWDLPEGELDSQQQVTAGPEMILLDPVEQEGGHKQQALAVEGDWHEIPSLKNMLYEDALQLKSKLKDMEQGAYMTIKDALKNALPHQYQFLKELKDILTDRNSVRDL